MKLNSKKIFNTVSPFRKDIFTEAVEERLILVASVGQRLTEDQFSAIWNAMKSVEEHSFDCCEVECGFESLKTFPITADANCDYKRYVSDVECALENCIISSEGTWGLIISHEEHAVLGGTKEFIEAFKTFYPDWEYQRHKFAKMWTNNVENYNSDVSWLEDFLKQFDNSGYTI